MLKRFCRKCLYTFDGTGDICLECLEKEKEYKNYIGSSYYVYEFIRLDTNEPFYVGKGQGNRVFRKFPNTKQRTLSQYIKELENLNLDYAVHIVVNNIEDEIEAYRLERKLIEEYVYEWGYDLQNLVYTGSLSKSFKEMWQKEEFREKVTKATKEAMQDESVKKKCSEAAKSSWQNEEYRAKITAALKRPRKSAPKSKPQVEIVNVETNEIIIVADGMSDAAKQAKEKLGFGSKKFAKLRNGEIFENLRLDKKDKK